MPTAQPQASVVTGGGDGRKLSGNLDDLQCTTAFVQRAGVSTRVADKTKTCSARQPSCREPEFPYAWSTTTNNKTKKDLQRTSAFVQSAGVSIGVVDNRKASITL